jgi:drug/metabolite transporter (DMT)-like permease
MVYYAHESSYHVALMFDTYGGGLAALTAAFLWAIASLVYRRAGKQIPPLELNLLKGVVALALLALTLLLTGVSLAGVEPLALGLMLLGGALGIGVGDTAYFESLNSLGARRALLLGILAPPIAALLALLLLGETLSAPAWAGILLTVLGVAWVVTERAPETVAVRAHLGRGLGFGLLSALAQAGGMVLSRAAFVRADISPLYGACLRLAAGIVTLLLWLALTRRPAPLGLAPLCHFRRHLPGHLAAADRAQADLGGHNPDPVLHQPLVYPAFCRLDGRKSERSGHRRCAPGPGRRSAAVWITKKERRPCQTNAPFCLLRPVPYQPNKDPPGSSGRT